MHYSSIRRKLSLLRKESSRVPFKYIYIFIFLGYLKLFINIIWPKTVHHYHYIIPVKSFYWKLNSIEFKGSRLSFENSFERKEEKKLKSIDENKESKKKKEKRKNGRKYISDHSIGWIGGCNYFPADRNEIIVGTNCAGHRHASRSRKLRRWKPIDNRVTDTCPQAFHALRSNVCIDTEIYRHRWSR